jgi:hypothetical protein
LLCGELNFSAAYQQGDNFDWLKNMPEYPSKWLVGAFCDKAAQ